MKQNKQYLFQRLRLENYMIHKDTDLHLSQRPIILITGANGSGKTQLLDALLICLGHHPKRLKKVLHDIIGKFDTHQKLRLFYIIRYKDLHVPFLYQIKQY